MKRKVVKILLNLILIIATSSLLGIVVKSSVENIYISNQIKEFKSKGVYVDSLSNKNEKYYKVSRETWMEDTPSYTIKDGLMTYGGEGDIIVGLKSNIRNMPIITETTEFLFGGHCSSVCFNTVYNGYTYTSSRSIESKPSGGVRCVNNKFWNDTDYQTSVIGLRVKASKDIVKNAFYYMADHIGDKYNSLYITKKNSYYCTDLISRAYKSQGIELNTDGFYVSVQDLVCSPSTYISFYKEYENGVSKYYFLGE